MKAQKAKEGVVQGVKGQQRNICKSKMGLNRLYYSISVKELGLGWDHK